MATSCFPLLPDSLLVVDGVSAGYGPFRSLFDVSFHVPAGGVVALLGPNGSGKTTMARVASGLVKPSGGTLKFDGNDVTRTPAYQMARRGIAHAVEGRSVFATLTVAENLDLTFRAEMPKSQVPAAMDRAYTLFPRIGERRKQLAGTLSGGEQRMLSLAKVMAHPPKLLVADELSLGLAPLVIDEVFQTLDAIRASGTALLIVEQHVHRALALADMAVLLQKGTVRAFGPVDMVREHVEELLPTA